jgi:hypothetical protein
MNRKYLPIYLNDHLAGATLGRELVRRALRSNRGTPLGEFLEGLEREIVEDRESLTRLIVDLGFKPSRVKTGGAVAAERVGRLKLNGDLTNYSPLSRLVELEGLSLGVEGKLTLWRNLRESTDVADDATRPPLDELIRRAERQRDGLEAQRLEAAKTALR